MSPKRQMVRIVVLGSIPEIERIDTSILVDETDYEISFDARPDAENFISEFDDELDVLVVDAELGVDALEIIDAVRDEYPFCTPVLVADPDRGAIAARAQRGETVEVVIRPTEEAAAVELVTQALHRALLPRNSSASNQSIPSYIDSVYEGLSVPFLVVDADYKIRYYNRGINRVYRAQEQLEGNLPIGSSIFPLLPQSDQAGFSVHLDRALRGERVTLQKNVEEFGDSSQWHEFTYQPIHDADGEVIAVGLSVLDVGARKETEQNLEESEERFWSIFESAQFGMTITDDRGRFIHANPAFQELLGYDEDELRGEPFLWVVHPDDRDHAGRELNPVDEAVRRSIRFETRYVRKDDEPVWSDVVAWPIRNRDDEVQYVVAVVIDISEQKRFEHQIQQAEKMQAVGRLASGFAHEFNNLLMAIAGYAHAVERELVDSSSAQRDLEKIGSLTEQGGELTRQLLTYSRHQESNPVELDLNAAITEMSQMLDRLFDRNITVELELAEHPPKIVADAGRIDQVLMNLALNARDAMPEGGRLTIATDVIELEEKNLDDSITRELGPGRYVVLVVRDTGIGMSKSVQSRIFEPFFSTKEIGEGTGLGLALVYGVLDQLGGTILVESEPERGTEFRLYFPA